MPNPLLSGMHDNENGFAALKNALNMLRAAQNPQAVLQQVAKKNPQLAAIMQMCSGKNPQEVFYELCRQRGVNPESILSQLR